MNLVQPVLSIMILAVSVNWTLGQEPGAKDVLPPASTSKTWKMVWHDEFDGTALDAMKWGFPPEGKRQDGYWMKKAVTLDGQGHLAIRVIREGDKYIDGCVRTKGKFEHAFGYYVARILCQKQPGHWTAFWLVNDSVHEVGNEGRDGTEIDIMERVWLDDRVAHNLHWDGYGPSHKTAGTVVKLPGLQEDFHTFGLLWMPDYYVFYVDGKETWRTSAGGVCQTTNYIKLSDEVGKWAGDIIRAQLPDRFLVDYVRVYDLVDK
jgi:beta-glucanase (GH16 family)